MEKVRIDSFCVIGKLGSTIDDPKIVKKLWVEADMHFLEVKSLAKKHENGGLKALWGIMSRDDMSFMPWQDNYSKGLYLAGVEVNDDAVSSEGWVKWRIPGFIGYKVKVEGNDTFINTIKWLKDNNLELAMAVQDYTDPQTQENYMLFPIERI